ncbi:MAG: hypothetical protein KDE46_21820 [Caldilineaceae bacterium]|nr:hypothetical protein [Caldilineaceae bacterium]
MTHVDIKRTVERLHPCIGHGVGPVERNLVPAERFFWWLMARHVMGRDTGFVVVGGRIPRLMIERFCLVNIASKLRLCPRRAKFYNGIVDIHGSSLVPTESHHVTDGIASLCCAWYDASMNRETQINYFIHRQRPI